MNHKKRKRNQIEEENIKRVVMVIDNEDDGKDEKLDKLNQNQRKKLNRDQRQKLNQK